ncbi:MAG: hypothetical protein ABH803_02100 [Candidatus Micrarchaeota archaeon]
MFDGESTSSLLSADTDLKTLFLIILLFYALIASSLELAFIVFIAFLVLLASGGNPAREYNI